MSYKQRFERQSHTIHIIVRRSTEVRLEGTCFRGVDLHVGGNFSRWESIHDLLADQIVLQELLEGIDELYNEGDLGKDAFVIDYGSPVGWASTDRLENYKQDDLEEFHPNRKSTAMRVKLDRKDLLAPKTESLTIVFEFKVESGEPTVVIHSIYPGEDVGELVGNITKEEQCVFFDWNHPGV